MEGWRTVETILRCQRVPYTRWYLKECFQRQPISSSLWAIERILVHYGVHVESRVVSKEGLNVELPLPFVAHVNGEFKAIKNIGERKKLEAVSEPFPALFCKKKEGTCEPDYAQHVKQHNVNMLIGGLTAVSIVWLLVLLMPYLDVSSLLAIVPAIGLVLSVLLLKMHSGIDSQIGETVCSAFGGTDCSGKQGQVLPKLFGKYDLSEAGIAFFVVCLIAALFRAQHLPLALVTVIMLPFTLWSLWWQWRVGRQWCSLCIGTMAVVWLQAISLFVISRFAEIGISDAVDAVGLLCIQWVVLQIVGMAAESIRRNHQMASKIVSLQQFKYSREVWNRQMGGVEERRAIDCSAIMAKGQEGKPVISVVSNPYCRPCATMHQRLDLLRQAGFSIQYIFRPEDVDAAQICKKIISQYFWGGDLWTMLTQWYEHGDIPDIDGDDTDSSYELQKHISWIANMGVDATPTIYVDGMALPQHYSVEDLMYLY